MVPLASLGSIVIIEIPAGPKNDADNDLGKAPLHVGCRGGAHLQYTCPSMCSDTLSSTTMSSISGAHSGSRLPRQACTPCSNVQALGKVSRLQDFRETDVPIRCLV